jgi:hypothetical protein
MICFNKRFFNANESFSQRLKNLGRINYSEILILKQEKRELAKKLPNNW